jgi:aspartate 1-decarboxylase
MFRTMLSAKIHMATVTEANLHYVGSITIDEDVMDAVGIIENEKVQVVNVNNGNRWETYALAGKRGTGVIGLNGAGARLVYPGDTLIIMAYKLILEKELVGFKPKVAWMNKDNTIRQMLHAEKAQTEYHV